jgi:hypothetical protein
MDEIELNSGVLYDPTVADAFAKLSANGGFKLT